jgi:hypothetical protein
MSLSKFRFDTLSPDDAVLAARAKKSGHAGQHNPHPQK